MYKLNFTQNAKDDMEKAVDYISINLNNPAAASDLAEKVSRKLELLVENPKMYQLCEDVKLKELEYRKIVVDNYIIVYKVNEEKQIIYVMRFFYGRQDYINLI